jgi:uncharacterized protein YegL
MNSLLITLILDASGSMMGKNIAILNATIVELFPNIKKFTNVKLRAIKFADSAEWHIGPTGLPINDFVWKNLSAVDCGETCTSEALNLICNQIQKDKLIFSNETHMLLLFTDGYCSDTATSFHQSIENLVSCLPDKNLIRIGIGVGEDYSESDLVKFTGKGSHVFSNEHFESIINLISQTRY